MIILQDSAMLIFTCSQFKLEVGLTISTMLISQNASLILHWHNYALHVW